MTAVIHTEQLTHRYGDNIAVNGLSLEVHKGEVFGFLGHNGAGKTTTVRLLNGLLAPADGTIRVLGYAPLVDGPDLRRRTGVLTENPSMDDRLTAWENLAIFAALFEVPRSEVQARVRSLLETFNLYAQRDHKVMTFSKGMKQRLALARALLHHPELIFLDEPTSGLDPVASRQIQEMILNLSRNQGCTVFICTHNLAEAQRICDRVAVMQRGTMLALGPPNVLAGQVDRGRHVQIETVPDVLDRAMEIVRQHNGAVAVRREGTSVLTAETERLAIPQLLSALIQADIPIFQVTAQEPTLEDVYFALHDHEQEKSLL